MKRIGCLLAAAALGAAACTGAAVPETTTTTRAPATTSTTPGTVTVTTAPPPPLPYGGSVRVGSLEEPLTLNWASPGGTFPIVTTLGQAYWTGVADIDGRSLEYVPDVVVELPSVGNGGLVVEADGTMTVRYRIRDEAVWADGTPISGEDFRFTYDTIMDPAVPVTKTVYEDILADSITVGPKSFSYRLAAPTVRSELLFDRILPAHVVAGTDVVVDWNAAMWVSGGPFRLAEWVPGEFLRVERNPAYWKSDPETGAALPYLDEVVFVFFTDVEDMVAAFAAGEIDVVVPPSSAVTPALVTELREIAGATVVVQPGLVWEHLAFQFGPARSERNPDSLNRHVGFRRAVALAVDRDAIAADVLGGLAPALDSFVTAYTPGLSAGAWDRYPHDPAAAADLIATLCGQLDRDCDAEPPRVVFTTSSASEARRRIAAVLPGMLAEAGIVVESELEERQIFFGATIFDGNWDLGSWAWFGAPGLTPLVDLFSETFAPAGPFNFYGWGVDGSDAPAGAIDRLATIGSEIDATVDEASIADLIGEGEEILADQALIIPLYARFETAAYRSDRLAGFVPNPTRASHTWNVEAWFRADR